MVPYVSMAGGVGAGEVAAPLVVAARMPTTRKTGNKGKGKGTTASEPDNVMPLSWVGDAGSERNTISEAQPTGNPSGETRQRHPGVG